MLPSVGLLHQDLCLLPRALDLVSRAMQVRFPEATAIIIIIIIITKTKMADYLQKRGLDIGSFPLPTPVLSAAHTRNPRQLRP